MLAAPNTNYHRLINVRIDDKLFNEIQTLKQKTQQDNDSKLLRAVLGVGITTAEYLLQHDQKLWKCNAYNLRKLFTNLSHEEKTELLELLKQELAD